MDQWQNKIGIQVLYRPSGHGTRPFSAQATATGTTHGLTAGNVTQAATDSDVVAALLDYDNALKGYGQAFTAWRDFIFFGDPGDLPVDAPTVPALTLPGEGDVTPGIRTRTRGFANTIKASPA